MGLSILGTNRPFNGTLLDTFDSLNDNDSSLSSLSMVATLNLNLGGNDDKDDCNKGDNERCQLLFCW